MDQFSGLTDCVRKTATEDLKGMVAEVFPDRRQYSSEKSESLVTARKRSLGQGNIFRSMCQEFCPRGGGEPSMPCRSHDQPAVYKQLHCWWVSIGEEAAYR